jgi:hypothetical protein
MRLVGCGSVDDLNGSYLEPAHSRIVSTLDRDPVVN